MDAGGAHAHLAAGERARRDAAFAQRHGQQRDRHLFAGGQQHVHFARIRFARDAGGEVDQPVGVIAHGGDDDGDAIAALAHGGDFFGDALDQLDGADRGAAVFLDDQGHRGRRRLLANQECPHLRAELGAHEGFDAGERGTERGRVVAAGLREVRPTAALAADLARHVADQLARLDLARVWSAVTPATSVILLVASTEASTMTALLSLSLSWSTALRSAPASAPSTCAATQLDARDVARAGGKIRALPAGELVLELAVFLFELADALERIGDLGLHVVARAAHQAGDFFHQLIGVLDVVERAFGGDGFDAAHARGHAALADDLEHADVAGARDVRAAAQLHRELAHAQHAHVFLVFLAEQRDGALGHGRVVGHLARLGGGVRCGSPRSPAARSGAAPRA